MPAKRPVRRPMRVVGKEPRPAAVTPARIARAMDAVPVKHLSEDQNAHLLVYLWEHHPGLKGCDDWDTRLFQAVKDELWDILIPLLRVEEFRIAFGRITAKRGQVDMLKHIQANLGDWQPNPGVVVNGDVHIGDRREQLNLILSDPEVRELAIRLQRAMEGRAGLSSG